MKRMTPLFLIAMFLLGQGVLHAEPRLAKIFSENMVLQRDLEVPVWGWADPGEEVSIDFAGQSRKTVADQKGEWKLKLDKMPASGEGREFRVSSPKFTKPIILTNVLVGDVWVCSGQSNMDRGVGTCNFPDDIRSANFPNIRCVMIAEAMSEVPAKDVPNKGWLIGSPDTVSRFTAVGFFFAREVHKETGLPIGILHDAFGGTLIEPWCSQESIDNIPELKGIYEAFAKRLTAYHAHVPKLKGPFPGPSTIFNGMVAPIIPYGIKGALWYQGEGNGGEGEIYFHKMRALIGGWRSSWRQGDFSFYFVQLCTHGIDNQKPEGGDGYAKIRSAQTTALSIPNTGMAVTIDIGDGDLHPKNKLDVGKRLALWALAVDYGKKDIVFSGPLFKEMKVEGSKVRLSFDYVGGGLMVGKKDGKNPTIADKTAKLKRFAIAGADKKWVWADAVIEKDSVVVSAPEIPSPVAVRYAFSANPAGANLYSREGLPASPFRTDNW